jgi:hypothetical protein
MLCIRRWNLVVVPLAVVVAGLAQTGAAQAQTEPFKITGVGVGTMGLPLPGQAARPHWIIGQATRLGRHYGEGSVQTDSAVFNPLPAPGNFTGEFGGGSPFVFTGANGDRLVTWYGRTAHGATSPGTFTLTIVGIDPVTGMFKVTAAFVAEFVAVPESSTGQFAGVTGSWVMYAFTEEFVLGSTDPINYWWEGRGQLTYQKP